MPQKKEKFIVLYPEYFNAKFTRAEGRRVSKKMAKPSPTVEDIEKAAKSLSLNPVVEKDKSYPKFWHEKRGRVLVEKKMPKTELLKKIGKALLR
ncbi:MAG: signal recognition particle subunit SRP19/SEC65 family protein [Thermoplasmata archaeon]